jgi:biopolymer transport protein ExbD
VRSEISVTPLVDVCLVLLIIFMVVAPLMTQRDEVRLPVTRRPAPLPEDAARIEIEVGPHGALRVDGVEVELGRLRARLALARAVAPDAELRILADERVSYRTVREAMELAQRAGFTGVQLATDPPNTANGAPGAKPR